MVQDGEYRLAGRNLHNFCMRLLWDDVAISAQNKPFNNLHHQIKVNLLLGWRLNAALVYLCSVFRCKK